MPCEHWLLVLACAAGKRAAIVPGALRLSLSRNRWRYREPASHRLRQGQSKFEHVFIKDLFGSTSLCSTGCLSLDNCDQLRQ